MCIRDSVILQGQGGDELFWGYNWVRDAVRQSERKYLLRQQGGLATIAEYLRFELPAGWTRLEIGEWVHKLAGLRPGWQSWQRDRHTPETQLVFYDAVQDFHGVAKVSRQLFTKSFLEQLNGSGVTSLFNCDDAHANIAVTLTRLICDTYLRENGVAQGDRLSMSSSVELRLPLLDHRLVETVIGLRKNYNDSKQPAKSWFRAAIRDLLPDWVINRPKRGFSPPVIEWHSALFAKYGETLAEGYLSQHEVLTQESARRLASGPLSDDSTTPLSFKALVLEQWCRRMVN